MPLLRLMENNMAHTGVNDPEMFCLDCEEPEAESMGSPRICEECGEQLQRSWPTGFCQECERKQTEERAEMFPFVPGALLAILLLCLPAFGQAVSSGHGLYSGFSSWSGQQSGLTYAARTDPCVFSGTGCTAATGYANSPLSFLGQNGDPMPWYQTTGTIDPAGTAITDPDFGSYQVIVTDPAYMVTVNGVASVHRSMNASEGEYDPFSQDRSLLLVSTDGSSYSVIALNTASIHNKTCATIPCSVYTGISASTHSSSDCTSGPSAAIGAYGTGCTRLNSGGAFSFSRKSGETTTLYELMGTSSNQGQTNTQVNKLAITCPTPFSSINPVTNPCTFTRTPYINFAYNYADGPNGAYPAACAVVPSTFASNSAWVGIFSAANDGSIGYATGGAGDWQANTAYSSNSQNDLFVYPQSATLNPGNYAYQATGACTTGSSEPGTGSVAAWNQTILQTNSGDGTCTWQNIGKIGGQDLGYTVLYYSPTLGCRRLNTRTNYIWNSGGASSPPAGQLLTDSAPAVFNQCLDQYDTCTSVGTNNTCYIPGGWASYTSAEITGCQAAAAAAVTSPVPLTAVDSIHDAGIKTNPQYIGWAVTGGEGTPLKSTANADYTYANQKMGCRGENTGSTPSSKSFAASCGTRPRTSPAWRSFTLTLTGAGKSMASRTATKSQVTTEVGEAA